MNNHHNKNPLQTLISTLLLGNWTNFPSWKFFLMKSSHLISFVCFVFIVYSFGQGLTLSPRPLPKSDMTKAVSNLTFNKTRQTISNSLFKLQRVLRKITWFLQGLGYLSLKTTGVRVKWAGGGRMRKDWQKTTFTYLKSDHGKTGGQKA